MMQERPVFQRLIRFIDDEGQQQYGDLPTDVPISNIEAGTVSVIVLFGDVKRGFKRTSSRKTVAKVAHTLK